jgi:hypothetical protein
LNTRLLAICALTTVIHAINVGAYAARLAGVRTGRLALAASLYNVLMLIGRGANTVAAPLIALIADLAAGSDTTTALLPSFRIILLSASAGTLLAGLLIPSLSRVLASAVLSYERRRSLPRIIVRSASVRGFWRLRQDLARPRITSLRDAGWSPFPKRFLVASILIGAVFTGSNFAALYASALVPSGARTATSLAPVLTGSAVLLNVLIVQPMTALVTDQALRRERLVEEATYITIWQVGAEFLGTLLAQGLLWPMGQVLAALTRWLVN